MENKRLDQITLGRLLAAQKNEITEHFIYKKLSYSEKDAENKRILSEISRDELRHYNLWKSYTGRDVRPSRIRIWQYYVISRLFGITFCIKLMEGGEGKAQTNYQSITKMVPDARAVVADEDRHERELVSLIDEERLKYVGSIVRGLNEALIELTAALSGLTLALHDTNFIALTGLITGLAMSLAMGGTEYLATKSENGHQHPVKSAVYTSAANLITVAFLIYPYLVFDNPYAALGLMLVNAVIVIYIFNYHISVTRELNFRKTFAEMLFISLSVSAIAFAIGYLARTIFHIEA
ncbi:MAG: rubrerythrin family protein [Dehalococcoidia bacterium]|nr:MAG: rubrerythrin family protein [Dehalococcoidia bacterium]